MRPQQPNRCTRQAADTQNTMQTMFRRGAFLPGLHAIAYPRGDAPVHLAQQAHIVKAAHKYKMMHNVEAGLFMTPSPRIADRVRKELEHIARRVDG